MVGRLDHLELHNFKSYGGDVVVGPFKGFTAVIGTNGSGKSNLMDAISFVLGVRTAQLRGNQLRDLVYRNPDDPSDDPNTRKAHVKLVYITSNGETVSFLRGVSTNGSSDYKLNGKTVSMEMYNKELASIGILVKTRNFLVFQNEVEGIASKTPKELTSMFEEISGSAELRPSYDDARAQKDAAEEEVMFLWRKRKGLTAEKRQYREQKEEAEKFQNLQRQIATTKTDLSLFKLYHLEVELNSCRKIFEEESKSLSSAEALLAERDADLNDMNDSISALEKQKSQLRKKLKRLTSELENQQPSQIKYDAEVAGLLRRIKADENNLIRARSEAEKREKGLATLQEEFSQVQASILAVQKDIEAADEANLSADVMREYKTLKHAGAVRTAALQQEYSLVSGSLQDAAHQKESAVSQYEAASARHSSLQLDLAAYNDRIENLARMEKSSVDELRQLEVEHAHAVEVGGEREVIRVKLEQTITDTTLALRDAKADMSESSHRRLFQEAFHSMSRLFPGVKGRLSDLCKPTQGRYREAVAVVLGKLMDAIVVDNEKTGSECINYLKEQRVGMATFIPLADVRPRPVDDSLRRLGGSARLVVDVLVHDESIAPAILYAAGNAVVCDSLDEARAIRYGGGRRLKICSLDGTLINKAGFMTGGESQNDDRAGKWDRAEIEALKRKRHHAQEELAALGPAAADRRNASERMERIDSLKRKISILQMDYGEAVTNSERALREVNSLVTELGPLRKEMESALALFTSAERKSKDLKEQMAAVENQMFGDFAVRHNFQNVQEFEQCFIQKSDGLREKKLELETRLSRLRSQIKYELSKDRMASVNRLEHKMKDQKARLETAQANLKSASDKKAELEERHGHLQSQVTAINEDIKSKLEATSDLRQNFTRDADEISSRKRELSMKHTKIDQLVARRSRILTDCRVEQIHIPCSNDEEGQVVSNKRIRSQKDFGSDEDGSRDRDSKSDEDMAENDNEAAASDGDDANRFHGTGRNTIDESLDVDPEIRIDYSSLGRRLKNSSMHDNAQEEYIEEATEKIRSLEGQKAKLNPNMRAIEHMNDVSSRLEQLDREADVAKELAKAATENYENIKDQRQELFNRCFNHIAEAITEVYKQLTRSNNYPMGGTAYLSVEQQDEPYLAGVKYNAMPPTKRFRDMDQLSGGERTVAALALLFAIHDYKPSPFFILDEVDAALDALNVDRVSSYVQSRAQDLQIIVITLKDAFFEKADALVGIYRDVHVNSSRLLTLDLTAYDQGKDEIS